MEQSSSSQSSSPKSFSPNSESARQLVFLLHAHKCNQNTESHNCNLPNCSTTKQLLEHIRNCSGGIDCQYAQCISSKKLIVHWRDCDRNQCPIYSKISDVNAKISTNIDRHFESSIQSSVYLIDPMPPISNKGWHSLISNDVRSDYIGKLMKKKSSFPTLDNIDHVRNLYDYAQKREIAAFENSFDVNEYHYLLKNNNEPYKLNNLMLREDTYEPTIKSIKFKANRPNFSQVILMVNGHLYIYDFNRNCLFSDIDLTIDQFLLI